MAEVGSGEVPIFPTFQGFRSKVVREVDGVGKESGSRFTSAFKTAVVGVAAVFATLRLKEFFLDGVRGASELEQSVGAVDAVFKGNADQINAWASTAAMDVGLTRNEFNELGTVIGAQLKNGGVAMDELAPKTNNLIGLGADLASMFGGTTREAVEAVSSALRGERDPIERYGVTLRQSSIDAEAAALGYDKVGGALSAQATTAATLSLIMKQTADSQGNFARESDTVAGKQQRLNALWEDGKTRIMSAFLPAVGAVTGFLVDKLPGAISGAEAFIGDLIDRAAELWKGITAPPEVGASLDGLAGFGATLRDIFTNIKDAVTPFFESLGQGIASGDFSGFTSAFEGFMNLARPAGPIIAEVGTAFGGMSGKVGELIAGALPLLTPLMEGAAGVMGFLADNTGILAGVIIALASAFALAKAAQAAANLAAVAAVPIRLAETVSNFALASATRAATAAKLAGVPATAAAATAQGAHTAAASGGALAMARQAAATVASRVAMLAGAAATGIAAAAQWAWNAAMTANPIGIIIVAIAALVGALVWFFTQTKLGKEIWANFTRFLTEAWNNIVTVARTVFTALASFFTGIWNGIVSFVRTAALAYASFIINGVRTIQGIWNTVWSAVSSFFTGIWNGIRSFVAQAIANVASFVINGANRIRSFWTSVWQAILSFVTGVWNGIRSFISGAINGVASFVISGVNRIRSTWTAAWQAISSFFSGIWNGILSFVRGVASNIVSAVSGFVGTVRSKINEAIGFIRDLPGKALAFLGNLGNTLFNAGRDLIGGFIDGIKDMIGGVGDAIGGVLDFAAGFFPSSPAKRGAFAAPGWRRLKRSGVEIGKQFGAGLERSKYLVDPFGGLQDAMASTVAGDVDLGVDRIRAQFPQQVNVRTAPATSPGLLELSDRSIERLADAIAQRNRLQARMGVV